ncbi:GNAT family N-acetyltransferase [Paractinoplanes lichenicola]|uniref:GNAT family N-acetyltransferase n=1 Tax=Paractinoplanes lichenicola TaxID=2802976 RepID=UPI0027DB8B9F|nr:GNAT family N-acetyltransferase [Actinoplanes lichenicola]
MRLHPRDLYVPLPAPVIARHSKTASLYVVRDGTGHVVGRTSTYRYGTCQLFGHTEFTDDDAVFAALMDVVTQEAEGRPLFGPVALLPNQTGGVITSGFESRGFVDSAWNPAYYPAMYERHGFTRRFEADTWAIDVPGSAGAYQFDDSRIAAEQLVIRHGTRRGLHHQLPILRSMLNASFAQLGYYTEISAAQLAEQTDGLAFLLDEGLLVWLERAGRPVAFVVAVPDISEFLMRTGGKLGLLDQVRLLATRSRYRRDAVLVIKGVIPEAQGQGYMTLLSREVHRHLEASGYRTLRSTFVERSNTASAASYRRAGGRPLHGYTFYERGAA